MTRSLSLEVSSDVHLLLVNMHHSVTDGRSLAVFRHELSTAYSQHVLKQVSKTQKQYNIITSDIYVLYMIYK